MLLLKRMNWSTLSCFCRRASFLVSGWPTDNGRRSKDTKSVPEGFSRKRWKGCESAPKQLQFTLWLNSMTAGQGQFPITCSAVGSGGLGADSWTFLSPCFGDMTPWKKTGQTATAIKLNLPPWCVNTSESSSNLYLHSLNTAGWLYPHIARNRALSSLQESPSHSTEASSRRPVPSLSALLVGP